MNHETAFECLQLVAATLKPRAKGEIEKKLLKSCHTPLPTQAVPCFAQRQRNIRLVGLLDMST